MSYLVNSYIVGPTGIAPGQSEYTTPGTYSWVAPDGVTSVSVVAIGGGGAGGADIEYRISSPPFNPESPIKGESLDSIASIGLYDKIPP